MWGLKFLSLPSTFGFTDFLTALKKTLFDLSTYFGRQESEHFQTLLPFRIWILLLQKESFFRILIFPSLFSLWYHFPLGFSSYYTIIHPCLCLTFFFSISLRTRVLHPWLQNLYEYRGSIWIELILLKLKIEN